MQHVKNKSLLELLKKMVQTLCLMFIFIAVGVSSLIAVSHVQSAWENIESVDAITRSAFMSQMSGSLSRMKTMATAIDMNFDSSENMEKLMSEYHSSEKLEAAVVTREGYVISMTPGFVSGCPTSLRAPSGTSKSIALSVLDVSPTQKFTVKEPMRNQNEKIVIPTFVPLPSKKGYMVVCWSPNFFSSKTAIVMNTPWISGCLASRNGIVIDSNLFDTGKELGWRYENGERTKIGEYSVYTSKIDIVDGDNYWWFMSIITPDKLYSGVFFKILWVLVFVIISFFCVFWYVRFIRGTIVHDISILVKTILSWFQKRTIDINEYKDAWSLEVKRVGAMISMVSHKLNDDMNTIQREAGLDKLTRLPNRETIEVCISEAQKKSEQFSLVFIDLDGFKPINDNLGHETGDMVLQTVAERLKETFRDGDVVSRWGGDEFLVLLMGDVRENSEMLIARLREKLSEIRVEALAYVATGKRTSENAPRHIVGASVGIAVFPDEAVEISDLIGLADARMYDNKEARKKGR